MTINFSGREHLRKRLWEAKPALPRESRTSLVQRICGGHQYSLKQLCEISEIRSKPKDWDSDVSKSDWKSLLKLSNLQQTICGEAIYAIELLCRDFNRTKVLLRQQGKPAYRWCSSCFRTDATPYLRWEWRLAGVSHCSKHHVLLDEQCPYCGSFLLVHRTLLVSCGSHSDIPNLATCQKCGMPLFEKEASPNAGRDNTAAYDWPSMKKVLRILKLSYLHNFKFINWDDPCHVAALHAGKMPGDYPALHVKSDEWTDEWSLLIAGSTRKRDAFTDDEVIKMQASGPKTKEPRKKWSASLPPQKRRKLANALLIIRAEKNAMRRESAKNIDPAPQRGFK